MRTLTRQTALELKYQRRATANIISSAPTSITLWRNGESTDDGAGGSLPVLPVQTAPRLRYFAGLVGGARTSTPGQSFHTNDDGDRQVTRYILVGEYDDDIRKGDWFFIGAAKYKVYEIAADRSFEVKAFCERVTDGS